MAWVTLNPFSHTSDLSHHQTWCFYLPPKSQCYNFWPLYHQHPGPRHCHLSPGLLQWPLHLGHFPWPAPLLSVCAPAAELGFQNVSQVTLLLCSKPSDSSPMLHILPAPQPASHSVSCPLWPLPSSSSLFPSHPASTLVLEHRRRSPTSWILHGSSATQRTLPQRVTWPLPSPPSRTCSNITSLERPSLTNLCPRTSHPPFHHHPHHQLAHHIFPYLTSLSSSWPLQYKDRTFICSLLLSLGTPIHNT